jgi:hypothetical protein
MSELGVAEAVPADLDIEPVLDESSHGVPLLIPTRVDPSTHVAMEEKEQQQPLPQRQQQQQQQLLSPSPPQQLPQQQQQAVPLPQQQQQQQVMQLGFDGPITSLATVHILILLGHLANVVMDFTAENLSTSGLVVSAFFFVIILGFITLNLIIVFINLDLPENRLHLHNLRKINVFLMHV